MAVYLISDGQGHVKIGTADLPFARLRQLQTGCPRRLTMLAVCTGGHDVEAQLHRLLLPYNVRADGEWFEIFPIRQWLREWFENRPRGQSQIFEPEYTDHSLREVERLRREQGLWAA